MLNSGNSKKKLVIVYEEKCKSYANHLMQLIGANDDQGEEVVGVKDGTVKAVMWDEKKYKDNEMTITSDEKVVFIGRSKSTKIINENAVKKYTGYGIEYGWLGNRAVITVDKNKITKLDYHEFISEAQLVANRFADNPDSKENDDSIADSTVAGIFGNNSFAPVLFPIYGGVKLKQAVLNAKKELEFQNESRKQRYNYAVLKFYYDHLSEFVEG